MSGFPNFYIEHIYKYIYIHSGQTILMKDIEQETGITQPTIRKYLKWLERRQLVKRNGKHFEALPF